MRSAENVRRKFGELFACLNSSCFLCKSIIYHVAHTGMAAVVRKIISVVTEHTRVVPFKLVKALSQTSLPSFPCSTDTFTNSSMIYTFIGNSYHLLSAF